MEHYIILGLSVTMYYFLNEDQFYHEKNLLSLQLSDHYTDSFRLLRELRIAKASCIDIVLCRGKWARKTF